MYSPSPKIIAYHGTYTEKTCSIIENNFFESKDHSIWLGDGVYFFIDGIGSQHPSDYAEQFAKDQAWDNIAKAYQKQKFSVLEAIVKINENKFLNLTDSKGAKLFNEFRDRAIELIAESGKTIVGNSYNDTDILKIMREELEIEFVKSDVYIKFAIQRVKKFQSIIPNVTVLVVNNPAKNIHKSTIKEIKKGDIYEL